MSKRKAGDGCNRRKRDGVISGMTFDPENGMKQNKSAELSTFSEEKVEKKGKPPEKDIPLVATRTSARVLNRQTQKREGSPPVSPPPCSKKQAKAPTKIATPETTKSRRTWESWSSEDKDSFFEGLYQFGKDFEAIQNLIVQKCKKRDVLPSVIKNREQVRHLYYRTWHKISKHIQQRPDVSKTTNELFGLINYGEFRKRVIRAIDDKTLALDDKTGPKLNELVRNGNTSVRLKGKIKNVRTPMCRALKNLANHEVESAETDIKKPRLPDHITMELKPKNNAAWAHVQTMAQNPCVRIKLRPEKHLSSVLTFLNKKWRPHRVRTKAQLKVPEEVPDKELSISLPSNTEILPISMEQSVYTKPRGELTLNNIITGSKVGPDGDNPCADQTGEKKSTAEDDPQTQSEDSCHSSDEVHDHSAEKSQDHIPIETDDNQNECVMKRSMSSERGVFSSIFDGELMDDAELFTAGNQILKGEGLEEPKDLENHKTCKELHDTKEKDDKKDNIQVSPSAFESLRKGWTMKESNKVTLAELWLAVGNPDKIIMHFEWVDCSNKIDFMQQSLANMLRRLIHLATTEFTDFSRQSTLATSPGKCAKCGCDNDIGDNKGTPPNNKKGNSKAASGKSPKTSVSFKSQATQTVNIFSGRSRGPVGRVLNHKFDQNVQPEQLVTQDGIINVRSTSDTVFRMPAIPIKTHTIRKDGVVNSIPKPVPSIVMPKKPRRSVQNRRPMVVQRTLLPKSQQVIPRQIVSMPVVPGDPQSVRNGSLVLPSDVSGADHISIIGGKVTSICQSKSLPTTTMSPASAGVVAVKHIVPSISPPTDDSRDTIVRGTEGEFLSMKVMQSDMLPTDDVSKLFESVPVPVLDASVSPSKILQTAVTQAGITALSDDQDVCVTSLGGSVENSLTNGSFKPTLTSSPPNSLFDISLSGLEGVVENQEGNPEMEISFDGNSVSSFSAFFDQAEQRLDDETLHNKEVHLSLPSADILEDISLSSLIATEVPKKDHLKSAGSNHTTASFNFTDNSLPAQVDLHSLMNESSLDYVSKFAELVEKIDPQTDTQKESL